jgi:hypothetical protein
MTVILDACQTTVPVGFQADCTANENIGDPVVFSVTDDGAVESLSSNVYDNRLVVGIINSKLSDTRCIVITMGILENISSGLTRGLPLWVSATGGLTTTKPSSGHWQVLGNAINSTSVSVNIEMRKVKSL